MTNVLVRAGRAAAVVAGCAALLACASTPEDVSVDAASAAAAAPAPVDETSTSYFEQTVGDRVFFATDTSTLTPEARAVRARQAQWLKINSAKAVVIEGHADERGTRDYNLALGARRAEAVKAFLVGAGVAESRIETVSYGRERPVEVCSNDACWARNRRAVTAPKS